VAPNEVEAEAPSFSAPGNGNNVGGQEILVITRKVGEQIRIADDIVVEVLDIVGSSVRIGIEAPPDIRIFRHELWLEIQEENKAASEASVTDLPPPSNPSSGT
jgi:carbon storage regulator